MYQTLAILALFIVVYSSVAGRIERSWLSGPIGLHIRQSPNQRKVRLRL
jgi:hypothetical protein